MSLARSLCAVSVPITRTAMHVQSSCERGVPIIILSHVRRFTHRHGTATGCTDVYHAASGHADVTLVVVARSSIMRDTAPAADQHGGRGCLPSCRIRTSRTQKNVHRALSDSQAYFFIFCFLVRPCVTHCCRLWHLLRWLSYVRSCTPCYSAELMKQWRYYSFYWLYLYLVMTSHCFDV